jgi:hypothetical protein
MQSRLGASRSHSESRLLGPETAMGPSSASPLLMNPLCCARSHQHRGTTCGVTAHEERSQALLLLPEWLDSCRPVEKAERLETTAATDIPANKRFASQIQICASPAKQAPSAADPVISSPFHVRQRHRPWLFRPGSQRLLMI